MNDRETWLARTFVELSDTLVDDFDLIDFMSLLAMRCRELFEPGEVGFLLGDHAQRLRVVGSSSERLRLLELFELQNDEGPCLDCYRTSQPVVNERLEPGHGRWPRFVPEARRRGFTMAHALPMRLRGTTIGAVNVLQDHDRAVKDVELTLAQSMADIATIGLLQHRAVQEATVLAEQLQRALNTRIVIEQAKGMLLERFETDIDTAFSRMRGYARSHNRLLGDVAGELLAGTLPAETLGALPPSGRWGTGSSAASRT